MKLHVGSGDKIWPGFVNCDLHAEADVNTDCRKLPFEDDSIEEIHSIHFVEHIPRLSVDNMLMDWHRVLKRGGKLVLEVPCLDKIAKNILEGVKDLRMTTLGIFGDPRDERAGMMHQWSYTEHELVECVRQCGFSNIEIKSPVFHSQKRDMRLEAIKP